MTIIRKIFSFLKRLFSDAEAVLGCVKHVVTSPCSLQVEPSTSFRASLVSLVQGMQIGLNEITKKHWNMVCVFDCGGQKHEIQMKMFLPDGRGYFNIFLQLNESYVIVVELIYALFLSTINIVFRMYCVFFNFFCCKRQTINCISVEVIRRNI